MDLNELACNSLAWTDLTFMRRVCSKWRASSQQACNKYSVTVYTWSRLLVRLLNWLGATYARSDG